MTLFLPVLLLAAQSLDKLPPANPIPYQENPETAAILATVDALFDAFGKGDAAAMLQHVHPNGRVVATGAKRDGSTGLRQQSWTEFAARITPQNAFQESISDPAIEIDGDVAMLWAPYVVRVGGKVTNCGYDLFDFVREDGKWKVMNITFSSRTTECPGQ